MTPVWNEADYYRARDAARAAWQRTSAQLALEEVDMSRAEGDPCSGDGCGVHLLERDAVSPPSPPVALDSTTTAPAADLGRVLRGRGQGGR